MKIYNKLVRDKIPQIIEADNNRKPITKILNEKEYKEQLDKKLQEEVKEYLKDDNLEEIADIIEVIRAIIDFKGSNYEDVEKIRKEKLLKRGGFKEKIFLESVLEEEE